MDNGAWVYDIVVVELVGEVLGCLRRDVVII